MPELLSFQSLSLLIAVLAWLFPRQPTWGRPPAEPDDPPEALPPSVATVETGPRLSPEVDDP